MTEDDRKARLKELEHSASNPWADHQTLLEYANAMDDECRRLREAQQALVTSKAEATATVIRKAIVDAKKYRQSSGSDQAAKDTTRWSSSRSTTLASSIWSRTRSAERSARYRPSCFKNLPN